MCTTWQIFLTAGSKEDDCEITWECHNAPSTNVLLQSAVVREVASQKKQYAQKLPVSWKNIPI